MKLDAAKIELINWLTSIDDEAVLSSLLFIKKSSEKLDWANNLTWEQKNKIEEGLKDVKYGRTTPRKKVWAKYGRKA